PATRAHRGRHVSLCALDRALAARRLRRCPVLRLGMAAVQPARTSAIRERLVRAALLCIAVSRMAATPAVAAGAGGLDRVRRFLYLRVYRLLPLAHLRDRSRTGRAAAPSRADRAGARPPRADPLVAAIPRRPFRRDACRAAPAHGAGGARVPPRPRRRQY